jgi:hypothetical protein
MAKKPDPVKQKAKRQKMIAAVGGVLLLALLAFQLPRTMKMLNSPGNVTTSASTTTTSTTTPGSTPLAPPSLDGSTASPSSSGGAAGASVATSSDGVQDPSTPLPADAGQLVSFSRFKSKDPFAQQITDCGTQQCKTGAASTGSGPATSPSTSSGGTGSSTGGSTTTPSKPAPPASTFTAKVTTATISVNGTVETVTTGKTFPAADPVFTLVRVTSVQAFISISGGSFESGAAAVGLRKGKTLTLENTADGTQYVLKLLGLG